MGNGDYSGIMLLLLATIFGEGRGANFDDVAELANASLALPEEDLDEIVAKIL